jgi:hypothetical protein
VKPSFVVHKTKYYAFDYHDDAFFSLRQLAEVLGIKLEPSKGRKRKNDNEDEEVGRAVYCFIDGHSKSHHLLLISEMKRICVPVFPFPA